MVRLAGKVRFAGVIFVMILKKACAESVQASFCWQTLLADADQFEVPNIVSL